MHHFPDTPALQRLNWILDGLNGLPDWGADAGDVLAPVLTEWMSIDGYVEFIRQCAKRFGPVTLIGVETRDSTARARLQTLVGEQVVTCTVEPGPPHRVVAESVQDVIPAGLNSGLPEDFAGYEIPAGARDLIVFSGVPGAGKSTLADTVGRQLGIPVFAIDWLLGALTPFGGRHFHEMRGIGSELLVTLALRQLSLGQSAILDAPFESVPIRDRLRSLADRANARLTVVHCVCTDEQLHKQRLAARDRGIPGWHNPGDWGDVSRRLAAFVPWTGAVLTIDATRPLTENVGVVVNAVRPPPTGPGQPPAKR